MKWNYNFIQEILKIHQLCQLRNAIKAVHELEKCSLVHPGRLNPPASSWMPLRFKGRTIFLYVYDRTVVGPLYIDNISYLFFWTITPVWGSLTNRTKLILEQCNSSRTHTRKIARAQSVKAICISTTVFMHVNVCQEWKRTSACVRRYTSVKIENKGEMWFYEFARITKPIMYSCFYGRIRVLIKIEMSMILSIGAVIKRQEFFFFLLILCFIWRRMTFRRLTRRTLKTYTRRSPSAARLTRRWKKKKKSRLK